MKPIIGIVSRTSKSKMDNDCLMVEEYYKNNIIRSGGIPLMILPTQDVDYYSTESKDINPLTNIEKEDLERILSMCDGILIPGSTRLYEYDFYIGNYVKNNNIPVLGICAGMQLLANLDREFKVDLIDCDNSHYLEDNKTHKVVISKDSLLYNIIGKEEIEVNSYHKYKVPNNGSYKVSATCGDIVEAIENNNYKFYLGVQWHPERLKTIDSKKIFDYFIEVSKKIH